MPTAVETPALIALWRALRSGGAFAPDRPLGEPEISWAIETGMGPLLYAAAEGASGSVPEHLMVRLKAADRWARVQQGDLLEAAVEVVDRCADRAPPLTLLKGISICGEYYASPHQRVLGDLDLLAEPEDAPAVADALVELGYRPSEGPPKLDYSAHHHLRPVHHPRTKVVVEVHTDLFPPAQGLGSRGPFARDRVRAERRTSTLEGRPVFRLSPELQIPYVATHWGLEFVPAAGPRALLDMILLVRGVAHRIEWGRVLGWLTDRRVAAHLHLMLSYLEERGLVELPPEVRADTKRRVPLSPAVLRILRGMIDRYQVRGVMHSVTPLPGAEEGSPPLAWGSFRSRLRTARTVAATRNPRGLLLPFDVDAWDKLLNQAPDAWRPVLLAACLLRPLGDPAPPARSS